MSTKMEQLFYHDDSFLLGYGHTDAALHEYKLQKQQQQQQQQQQHPMSLSSLGSLNEPYRSLKSDAIYHASQADVGSLKLASPELERLIIQNSNGVLTTPTPSGQYLYGHRAITDEQEGFAEGFVKALDELHKMNQPPPNVSIGAGGVTTCSVAAPTAFGSALQPEAPVYTTLNPYCPSLVSSTTATSSYPSATISYLPPAQADASTQAYQSPLTTGVHPTPRFVTLKEEPQTVPDMHSSDGSPPVSPIDMESQERIKAERKRLRNRLAATKCRRRKLERIARLEDRVKVLKTDNAGLSSTASLLREQVAQLKQKVLRHVSSGCQLMLTSKMEAF